MKIDTFIMSKHVSINFDIIDFNKLKGNKHLSESITNLKNLLMGLTTLEKK